MEVVTKVLPVAAGVVVTVAVGSVMRVWQWRWQ